MDKKTAPITSPCLDTMVTVTQIGKEFENPAAYRSIKCTRVKLIKGIKNWAHVPE
jgi:hypothetical protein